MDRRLGIWAGGALLWIFACTGNDPVVPIVVGGAPSDAGAGANDATIQVPGSTPPATCAATETACGKACVDLQTSTDHCGRCDHSCGDDGCNKGRCLPVDLLDGLDFPTTIATHDGTTQVLVNANKTIVKCGKAGCGKVATPLWSEPYFQTNEDSPIAMTYDAFATLVYDEENVQHYVFDEIVPEVTRETIYPPPTTFARLAGDSTPDGGRDVAAMQGYEIYRCPAGICADGVAIKYVGEDGETNIAIQPGNPGYYVWNTYGNLRYCARGSADAGTLCTPQNVVATDIPMPSGHLAVTATKVYWTSAGDGGLRVYACAFPGGCETPILLVEGETMIDGFAADDQGIYWTDRASGVLRACLDTVKGCGSSSVTLLSNLSQPHSIALDREAIYFTQRGGVGATGKVTRLRR